MIMENAPVQAPDLDPPERLNPEGEVRRVGVEIEFAGLRVCDVPPLVSRRFGGTIQPESDYRVTVASTRFGDFVVELDLQYAHAKGDGGFERAVADAAGALGELFAPVEIVAPPIPYSELGALDALVSDIRGYGAQGTASGMFAAYGCHLNPEVASLEARHIAAHLKAYLILSAWLREDIGLDLTRQLTPFIDPFPTTYARRVVDPSYWPDIAQLIDDYLEANATRNRELDMLPLFAALDEDRVRRRLDEPRIKPRPTFHYRLPNSRVDEPHWRITREWQRWLRVERLANDPARLDDAARAFCSFHDRPIRWGWAREAAEWA
ncbi:MAG: hypothetical protein D6763_03860 [Alphaproteobacteria bacterium]|nr:MAG: hypothetical protein D6763_03860 [Alphaproteobacteria bacterium]